MGITFFCILDGVGLFVGYRIGVSGNDEDAVTLVVECF